MFKIVAPSFAVTVKVDVPIDGGHRQETIRATFRVLTTTEFAKFNMGEPEQVRDALKAVVVRLDDLQNEAGAEVPYSDAVLDQVIELPYARHALVKAYLDGVIKAKPGN